VFHYILLIKLQNEVTREETQEALDIKDKPLDKFLKTLKCKNGKY